MTIDPNVEDVRKVREELLKRHGGLQGWIRQLQQEDKKSIQSRRQKQRSRMRTTSKSKELTRGSAVKSSKSLKKQ
jgi:hypothetical protein